MYHDQRRDRDALRAAHVVAKRDHEQWAKKLYAEARETGISEGSQSSMPINGTPCARSSAAQSAFRQPPH